MFAPTACQASRTSLKDGLPRVCDLKPDAPTYLFERGDEKRPKKDEVIEPGVPASLGPR